VYEGTTGCGFLIVTRVDIVAGTESLLQDIESAIAQGTAESRARALWYATDLLIAGTYTENEVWVFGEVIGRLADEIEVVARAKLAKRLARAPNAPVKVINKLAFDDSINVAGPVLRYSERLDQHAVEDNAKTKSQSHLLAISKRRNLPKAVTDVLVTRGNQQVVHSVAANAGADFSNFGFLHMIRRSEGDSILAENLGTRKDIPRHLFQQLIAKASVEVRLKLQGERPDLVGEIQTSVTEAAGALQSKFGPASKNYCSAKRIVAVLHQQGNLTEERICEYARFHEIEEATVGLSLLSSLPVNVVERALAESSGAIALLLDKGLGFSWETAMSMLFLGARDHRIPARDLDNKKEQFERLRTETCLGILELYRARRRETAAEFDHRRLPQLHSL
jgi:uncharacterized protein (DUF2336 family)